MSGRRYVVVGSGIAALSAAEAIRRRDDGGRITLVSAEPHPFYSRPGLAYYLDRSLPESQLRIRTDAEMAELRLHRVHGGAFAVDSGGHAVTLDQRGALEYDRLLLATGAASVEPDFPGADLRGVFHLDGLDDARRIDRAARSARVAVVVGGGSTALELAEAFVARGVKTHYLLRGDRYWSRVLDPAESAAVESALTAQGATVHRRTDVVRAVGRDGRLQAVETRGGVRIPCDLLAVAVGVRPRSALAAAAGICVDRGILTDEHMSTSAPDVFAAGDVAQVLDPISGEATLDTLWASAAAQGRVAGENMAGGSVGYVRGVPMNVTRLAGLSTTILGSVGGGEDADLVTITRGQSERWSTPADARTVEGGQGAARLRLVLGPTRIYGAVVMGDSALARPLATLIAERVDIAPLRAILDTRPESLIAAIHRLHDDRPRASAGDGHVPRA